MAAGATGERARAPEPDEGGPPASSTAAAPAAEAEAAEAATAPSTGDGVNALYSHGVASASGDMGWSGGDGTRDGGTPEARAAPNVTAELDALFYDAHVAMCRPSRAPSAPSHGAADGGPHPSHETHGGGPLEAGVGGGAGGGGRSPGSCGDGTADGGGVTGGSSGSGSPMRIDAIASLRALLRAFPQPPSGAALVVLEGSGDQPSARTHGQDLSSLSSRQLSLSLLPFTTPRFEHALR